MVGLRRRFISPFSLLFHFFHSISNNQSALRILVKSIADFFSLASQTTLLNVLAGRAGTGVIRGDRFVNGQDLPHDFQAQTYVSKIQWISNA